MAEELDFITDEDRVALLTEGVAVKRVQFGGRYPGVMVSAPDAMRARELVCQQLGVTMDVWVHGEAPRDQDPSVRRIHGTGGALASGAFRAGG